MLINPCSPKAIKGAKMKPSINQTRKTGLLLCSMHGRPLLLNTLLCIVFAGISLTSFSQCINSGNVDANTFTNDAYAGTIAFINPGFAQLSDANRSSAGVTISNPSGTSNYLKATGFSFSIPPGSNICGVYAEIQKNAVGTDQYTYVTDEEVKLVKGGVIVGDNAALQGKWPATESYFTYGTTNDMWSTTLTPADVNAPDFGIIISVNIKGTPASLPAALINHIRMYIYYTPQLLPVKLVSFDAAKKNNSHLHFKWVIAGEEDVTKYVIEESAGATGWSPVYETVPLRSNNGSYEAELPLPDNRPHFYRLHIHSKDGSAKFSSIKSINGNSPGQSFSIFTDHSAGNIRISNLDHAAEAIIINMQGMKISRTMLTPGILNRVDVSALPRGLYVLRIENFSYKFAW